MIVNPSYNPYTPRPQSGQTTLATQSGEATAKANQAVVASGEQAAQKAAAHRQAAVLRSLEHTRVIEPPTYSASAQMQGGGSSPGAHFSAKA